jgi:predicted nucleotidyltransferase
MSVLDLPIPIDHEKIAGFCKARGIRRMSLFGSVLRPDFNPETSDVDVYAEFQPGALNGIGLDYFGYGDELAPILGHKVDFCAKLNKHILPAVSREMVTIYEQP